jgi:hypothetical protein
VSQKQEATQAAGAALPSYIESWRAKEFMPLGAALNQF